MKFNTSMNEIASKRLISKSEWCIRMDHYHIRRFILCSEQYPTAEFVKQLAGKTSHERLINLIASPDKRKS